MRIVEDEYANRQRVQVSPETTSQYTPAQVRIKLNSNQRTLNDALGKLPFQVFLSGWRRCRLLRQYLPNDNDSCPSSTEVTWLMLFKQIIRPLGKECTDWIRRVGFLRARPCFVCSVITSICFVGIFRVRPCSACSVITSVRFVGFLCVRLCSVITWIRFVWLLRVCLCSVCSVITWKFFAGFLLVCLCSVITWIRFVGGLRVRPCSVYSVITWIRFVGFLCMRPCSVTTWIRFADVLYVLWLLGYGCKSRIRLFTPYKFVLLLHSTLMTSSLPFPQKLSISTPPPQRHTSPLRPPTQSRLQLQYNFLSPSGAVCH